MLWRALDRSITTWAAWQTPTDARAAGMTVVIVMMATTVAVTLGIGVFILVTRRRHHD